MASENNLVNKIVKLLDSKIAKDISVLNVSSLTTLTDYFIIATGNNDKQTKAICDFVEEELVKEKIYPVNKEGYRAGEWILLGYNDIVIHIFQPQTRDFYDLEHVWLDGIRVDVQDLID